MKKALLSILLCVFPVIITASLSKEETKESFDTSFSKRFADLLGYFEGGSTLTQDDRETFAEAMHKLYRCEEIKKAYRNWFCQKRVKSIFKCVSTREEYALRKNFHNDLSHFVIALCSCDYHGNPIAKVKIQALGQEKTFAQWKAWMDKVEEADKKNL